MRELPGPPYLLLILQVIKVWRWTGQG